MAVGTGCDGVPDTKRSGKGEPVAAAEQGLEPGLIKFKTGEGGGFGVAESTEPFLSKAMRRTSCEKDQATQNQPVLSAANRRVQTPVCQC